MSRAHGNESSADSVTWKLEKAFRHLLKQNNKDTESKAPSVSGPDAVSLAVIIQVRKATIADIDGRLLGALSSEAGITSWAKALYNSAQRNNTLVLASQNLDPQHIQITKENGRAPFEPGARAVQTRATATVPVGPRPHTEAHTLVLRPSRVQSLKEQGNKQLHGMPSSARQHTAGATRAMNLMPKRPWGGQGDGTVRDERKENIAPPSINPGGRG